MSSKKRIAAVAITVAALTTGSLGVASAQGGVDRGLAKATALADLVKAGTISQAQADAISKRFNEFKASRDNFRAAHKADHEAHRAAVEGVITSTLGINTATIKSRLEAGETLASIAGAKKDELISALVTLQIKEIDERVSAGKLTAEQATTMKTKVKDHVTKMVESGKGAKGLGNKGGKGHKGSRH